MKSLGTQLLTFFVVSTVLYAGDGRIELSQIDMPIVVTNSGSYVVTSELVGTNGAHGIAVSASCVTLDLNGFALVGVPGSLNGINIGGSAVTVHSGTVRNWDGAGIMSTSSRCQFRDIVAQDNFGAGLVADDTSIIRDCIAYNNVGNGIQVDNQCLVLNCVSSRSEANGFKVGEGSIVDGCTTVDNQADGVDIYGGIVRNTISRENDLNGADINVAYILNCRFHDNQSGVRTGDSFSRIEGNHITDNGTGILATSGADNLIIRNYLGNNTVSHNIDSSQHYGQVVVDPGAGFTSPGPWANLSD